MEPKKKNAIKNETAERQVLLQIGPLSILNGSAQLQAGK